MSRPSSPWSALEGLWQTALTRSEWLTRFDGAIPAVVQRWLRPGPRAKYVHCVHEDGCHQPHRVVRDRRGNWFAAPEEPDCESFKLTEDALSTFSIDLRRLCQEVATALDLAGLHFERFDEHPYIARIGRVATTHADCIVVFSLSDDDLASACEHLVARTSEPFIALTPHGSHVNADLRARLSLHRASVASFPEVLTIDPSAHLRAVAPLSDLIPKPRPDEKASRSGGSARFKSGNTWPYSRPEHASWSDVSMTFQLQEVHIRFGTAQGSFDYRDIDGFTDRRGGKRPNRLWHLLRAFASRHGRLPLPSKRDDPVRVRTLAELDRVLRRFFGIHESAFLREKRERLVHTRFRVTTKT